MPGEVGGDDVYTGLFQCFAESDDLVPAHSAFQHVHRRDAEDQYEILADRRAGPLYNFDGKSYAVFIASAIFIFPQIGFLDQKGGNEIAG